MTNYLLTGMGGFQGSHLAESLAKDGHYVRGLNTPSEHARRNWKKYLEKYPNIDMVWGSVSNIELLETCMDRIECIFHLGAKISVPESLEKPEHYAETNLKGTQNVVLQAYSHQIPLVHASTCEVYGANLWNDIHVLENARKFGIQVIHVSSSAVYGQRQMQERYLMNEYHPLNPMSPYAASKAAGDRMVHAYCCSYPELQAVIVRPFNIFGPRQKDSIYGSAIPTFFKRAAITDEILQINGDGKQTRDFLYVDDLVAGYRVIEENITELKGQAINLGSQKETEIGWLAHQIVDRVGKGVVRYTKARPGEVDSFICDNTKISKLGWEPKIGMEEGLDLYWAWLQEERK